MEVGSGVGDKAMRRSPDSLTWGPVRLVVQGVVVWIWNEQPSGEALEWMVPERCRDRKEVALRVCSGWAVGDLSAGSLMSSFRLARCPQH